MYNKELIKDLLFANPLLNNVEIAKLYNESAEEAGEIEYLRRAIAKKRFKLSIPHPFDSSTNKTKLRSNINDFSESTKKVNHEKGTMESHVDTTFEPKSDLDLALLHKIDLTKYYISQYWSKLKSNGNFTSSVLCTLIKKGDLTVGEAKENFLDMIRDYSPDYSKFENKFKHPKDKNCMLEISIPDLHIGKLAWVEETGENYDTKEAIKRFNKAVDTLLSRVNLSQVGKFLFPVGNDLIQIDRPHMTTAGTVVDSDSRWQQMFRKAKELLISNIDKLSRIAPVEVVVVSGNHDSQSMLFMGEVLSAWYRTSNNVNINNEPTQRKYVEYGENLIGFTHGNEEKHQDLGLIMATEQKEAWARTKFREVHLGHLHKTKTIQYTNVDEFQGFRVRVLPSLSGSDAWHNQKGYMSNKAAEAFLYDKEEGLISTVRFNLK